MSIFNYLVSKTIMHIPGPIVGFFAKGYIAGEQLSDAVRVGKQLNSSVENYNKAVGSLERKVLPGARKFTELGVHPKKEIESVETLEALPRTLVDPTSDNEEDTKDGKTLQ